MAFGLVLLLCGLLTAEVGATPNGFFEDGREHPVCPRVPVKVLAGLPAQEIYCWPRHSGDLWRPR